MEALFTREGTPHTGPFGTNAKGKPVFQRQKPCSRCGGPGGGEQWRHTGWTCFQCGGTGKGALQTVNLFTAAELEKLNARLAKTTATKQAKAAVKAEAAAVEAASKMEAFMVQHGALFAKAEPFAAKSEFIADVLAKGKARASLSEKQVAAVEKAVARFTEQAAKAAGSEFVGTVGQKFTAPVTVERVTSFERAAWRQAGTETVFVTTMRTAEGAAIVVMSPAFRVEQGEAFTVTGTVKAHKEFRGEKQTMLNRAKATAKAAAPKAPEVEAPAATGKCNACIEFAKIGRCSMATHLECDCPKCQGFCECQEKEAA